jgi:uncharacterized membrane protein YdcZ (DUF606 family)
MSKNKKVTPKKSLKTDFDKEIMTKISSGVITMKPKWYFVAGSLIGLSSLVGLSIGIVYLTNIMFFLLRKHGPMGQWRLEAMLNSFSWWIPIAAIVGIMASIWLLKKYDFSYKKNFHLVVIGFIASIIIAALLIDNLGLNEVWSKRGPMRRFYQRLEMKNNSLPGNQKWMENSQGKFRNLPDL